MLLLWCLVLGWLLAYRSLGLRNPLEVFGFGTAASLCLLLQFTNLVLNVADWSKWPTALVLALILASLVVWRFRAQPEEPLPIPKDIWVVAALALVHALVLCYVEMDDDYWIHTPLQGLLVKGDFPPHNPFFSDLSLKGHYGRDLLIAAWARLTGLSTFGCQYLLTSLLQSILMILLYCSLRRVPGAEGNAAARWGTLLGAFCIQVGGRVGLFDLVSNNNPVANMFWILVFYAFVRGWNSPGLLWGGWLGILLGGLAFVYETHFGLCALACLGAFLFALTFRSPRAPLVQLGLVAATLSGILAFTQGGPLTELAHRKFSKSGPQVSQSVGSEAQSQKVEIKFPKARLGQIRANPSLNYRAEEVDPKTWIYYGFSMPDPNAGYVYFWHPLILGLHHWPLWLSPLLLLWTIKTRNVPMLWLWIYGAVAFSVPPLVDFGPVFEGEFFRWEFAAGMGFTPVLGYLVGPYLERDLRSRSGLRATLWFLWLITCTHHVRFNIGFYTPKVYSLWLQRRPIRWGAKPWVLAQAGLNFQESDWNAADWLWKHARFGQHMLVETSQRDYTLNFYEGTLAARTGLFLSGFRLPLDDDMIGQPPWRKRAYAECYFASGDPAFLDLQRPDWIFWRHDQPPVAPAARAAEVEWHQEGARCIGKLKAKSAVWPLHLAEPGQDALQLENLPTKLPQGHLTRLKWKGLIKGRLVIVPQKKGQPWSLEDAVAYPEGANEGPWLSPYGAGSYQLHSYRWDEQGLHPLPGQAEIVVDTLTPFRPWKVAAVQASSLTAGQWSELTFDLMPTGSQSGDAPLRDLPPVEGVVGCLSFTQVESGQEEMGALVLGFGNGLIPKWPGEQLQTVRQLGPRRLSMWIDLPEKPGKYRVDLLLSPYYGVVVRYRGHTIEVKP